MDYPLFRGGRETMNEMKWMRSLFIEFSTDFLGAFKLRLRDGNYSTHAVRVNGANGLSISPPWRVPCFRIILSLLFSGAAQRFWLGCKCLRGFRCLHPRKIPAVPTPRPLRLSST